MSYADDFYAWTQQQADALRRQARHDAGNEIDWENLAEEIESLGKRDRREVRSRLALILQHLLKWKYQPERQSRDWRNSIRTQRRDLSYVIEDSPSLRPYQAEILTEAYADGRREALEETGIRMPEDCPWTIEQVLDPDFLP